jgi:hypothetical protein
MEALRLICQAVDNGMYHNSTPLLEYRSLGTESLCLKIEVNNGIHDPFQGTLAPSTLLKMESYQHFAKLWMAAVSVH